MANYVLDLNAQLGTNYIETEHKRPTDNTDNWLIIPPGGVFYTKDLIVRNKVTGRELRPLIDYRALEINREATMESGGKETATVIFITTATVTDIIIKRRVVGGHYQVVGSDLESIITADDLNDLNSSAWNQTIGRPNTYPAAAHGHISSDVYGMEHVVYLMEEIRQAILMGDSAAFAMFYQYIDRLFQDTVTNIDNSWVEMKKFVDLARQDSKIKVGQIVAFNSDIHPAQAFGYGTWRRIEDTILYAGNNESINNRRFKKVGEGADHLLTGFAFWELVSL